MEGIWGDGTYGPRAVFGSNSTCLLRFFVGDNRTIIANCFVKRAQRILRSEIGQAMQLEKDWIDGND